MYKVMQYYFLKILCNKLKFRIYIMLMYECNYDG